MNTHYAVVDFAGCSVGGSDGCTRFDDPENKLLINCLSDDFTLGV